ncbi:hypothetical protein GOP47_0003092 [Adiantum capillus-veneris]|uniref:Pinin/SDK/MemA protein domain-containing protein n=1 Tax=Adiantum capillus-veneris TaxID=13818 RepID=A0A9D4ZPS2_ADICA|nr:hypothetical protein GOP47_0003092 [Adiantum capillus-veneris]
MAATEKSAEQLQQEIDELYRRKREITERLRDPRGLRRGMPYGRNAAMGGTRPLAVQRGVIRRPEEISSEDQPPPKKRISSTVVKVNDEKPEEAGSEALNEESANATVETKDGDFPGPEVVQMDMDENEVERRSGSRFPFLARRDYRRGFKDLDQSVEPAPRVLTKEENPSMAKRNRRMFGALLGTLQKFVAEDVQLSSSDAFTRRSDSLKRAELKALEESERLRRQEREELAEKRRRDLSLRARIAAKAEEKQLELLFIHWTEHHSKLSKFLRTSSDPPVYYMPATYTEELEKLLEDQQKDFLEWKEKRREELTKYQKDLTEWHLTNVEAEIERWINRRNATKTEAEVVEREEDDVEGGEGSQRGGRAQEEEEEEVEEDFMAEDDILGVDQKDQEPEREPKGVVEYASAEDDAIVRP